LRAEFLASVDEAISRVARLSAHLSPIRRVDPTLAVKRVYLQRFPFAVIFIELPDRIRILAVAHNRRKPFYWRERVND
jgi:toxin ParE1/3/4